MLYAKWGRPWLSLPSAVWRNEAGSTTGVGSDPAWPGVMSVGGLMTSGPLFRVRPGVGGRPAVDAMKGGGASRIQQPGVESPGGASSRRCEVEPLLAKQVGPHLRVFKIDLRNREAPMQGVPDHVGRSRRCLIAAIEGH